MRRLPVYLLIDVSGSMAGEPIEAVKNGLQTLVSALRQDPYALETAYLSVITFGSTAQQVVPLTELTAFQVPALTAGGTTSLGAALDLLTQKVKTEVALTTPTAKGDWKPLVFLMTDGLPTDDLAVGLANFKAARLGTVIACAAGQGASSEALKKITDTVVALDTADSATIKAFFKWVSASVSMTSQKVDLTKKEIGGLADLPPPPPEVNVVV